MWHFGVLLRGVGTDMRLNTSIRQIADQFVLTILVAGVSGAVPITGIGLSAAVDSPGGNSGTACYSSAAGINSCAGGLTTSLYGLAGVSPNIMPFGLTNGTLEVTAPSSYGGGGSAIASASLNSGQLKAYADSGTAFTGCGSNCTTTSITSVAEASFVDNLTFSILNGAPSAQVTLAAHMDGTRQFFANNGSSTNILSLVLTNSAFSFVGSKPNAETPGTFGHNGPSGVTAPYGWDSYSFTNESENGFDFTGVFTVTNGQQVSLRMALGLDCRGGALCNFANTSTVGLTLPSNVTYSSASGVFLSSAPQGGGADVPEPSQVVLVAIGLFGMVGTARRRRN